MFPRVLNSEEVELGLAVSCSRQQETGKFLAKSSAGRRWKGATLRPPVWIGSETEGSSSPCARESSLHINLFAVVVNHVCCKGAKRKTWLSTYLQRIMRAALAFEQLPSGVCQGPVVIHLACTQSSLNVSYTAISSFRSRKCRERQSGMYAASLLYESFLPSSPHLEFLVNMESVTPIYQFTMCPTALVARPDGQIESYAGLP